MFTKQAVRKRHQAFCTLNGSFVGVRFSAKCTCDYKQTKSYAVHYLIKRNYWVKIRRGRRKTCFPLALICCITMIFEGHWARRLMLHLSVEMVIRGLLQFWQCDCALYSHGNEIHVLSDATRLCLVNISLILSEFIRILVGHSWKSQWTIAQMDLYEMTRSCESGFVPTVTQYPSI